MDFLNNFIMPRKLWNFIKRHIMSWNFKMVFYFIYMLSIFLQIFSVENVYIK